MFGQNEAYDLQTDTWEHYTLMLMPRRGLGVVAIDAAAYVAGGGPIMGDNMQSAVHEAYMLGDLDQVHFHQDATPTARS